MVTEYKGRWIGDFWDPDYPPMTDKTDAWDARPRNREIVQTRPGRFEAQDKDAMTDTTQYIIIWKHRRTVPGDLRSQTHPGHGYPEHTVDYHEVKLYTDRDEWEDRIQQGVERNENFEAGKFVPAIIETKVVVMT